MFINYWHIKTLSNSIKEHLVLCYHYRTAGKFVYTGEGSEELNYSMSLISVYVEQELIYQEWGSSISSLVN